MTNIFPSTPATGVACKRSIFASAAAHLILVVFALLAFAQPSNAKESEAMPTTTHSDGKTVEVTISNFTFTPSALTITAGTTVKWVNHDDIPHLVAEKGLAFKSPALDTNDAFSFTFTKPGDVEYFCVLHPHMTGKISVKSGEA